MRKEIGSRTPKFLCYDIQLTEAVFHIGFVTIYDLSELIIKNQVLW